jgi:hypothetical protein
MPHDLLLVLAHPDDESFLAAGTVARLAEAGRPAGLVCATRGQAGALGEPPLATRETIGQVREAELRDACAVLGVDLVALLEHEDRQLAAADPAAMRAALVGPPAARAAARGAHLRPQRPERTPRPRGHQPLHPRRGDRGRRSTLGARARPRAPRAPRGVVPAVLSVGGVAARSGWRRWAASTT